MTGWCSTEGAVSTGVPDIAVVVRVQPRRPRDPLLLLIVLPSIGKEADRAGLPGGPIALAIIFAVEALSVVAVVRLTPSGRRRSVIKRAARGLGLRYTPRFALPRGLRTLPSFSVPGRSVGFGPLVSGRSGAVSVLVFDYRTGNDMGYLPPRWHTAAARTIGHVLPEAVRFPSVVIEPRTLSHPVEQLRGLPEVVFELDAFNSRFRVTTEDARFASAFIDQRMMAWLLERSDVWSFEVSGDWALCTSSRLDAESIPSLIGALDGLCSHIPRVAASIFPSTITEDS
jgi:hypothetical protein